jgi:hypothetical protein
MDVLVQRIVHGWLNLEEITEAALTEHVELANKLYGVTTVVFLNLPFINNVIHLEHMRMTVEKRQLVQDFAQEWERGRSGIDQILVMEMGEFTDQLYE